MIVRILQPFFVAATLVALTACGGGKDERTYANGPPAIPEGFTISTDSVTFAASVPGAAPPSQVINGTVTGIDSSIYFYVTSPGTVVGSAQATFTGLTTGRVVLFARPPAQLGPGSFTETITVRACLDANCTRPVVGSPKTIQVTYNISGITASRNSVQLSSIETIAPAVPAPVNIASGSNWTSSITYGNGASGWLTLNPASGSTNTPVSFTGSTLTAGMYSATVVFTSGASTISVPVTYNVDRNLNVNTNPLAFLAVAGQPSLPGAFTPTITAAAGSTPYTTSITYGAGASNWLGTTGSVAPGNLWVAPTTTSLAPGATYSATVVLTPSSGTALSIPVTYTVIASSLVVNPAAVVFDINAASTTADSFIRRQVTTSDTGAQVSWSAVASVPWLTVSPSGTSGAPVTLTLVPGQFPSIPNGPASATVTFTYNGPGVINAVRTLPVTLNMNLPTVHYVSPYVAYVNEQLPVIVRGAGFAQPDGNLVTFNGVAVAGTVISDTELRLTPPAFANPVRATVSVANALNVTRTSAELVVRNHPNYGYFALAHGDVGPHEPHVTYDAERDAVFATRSYYNYSPTNSSGASHVYRYAYDSGNATWSLTTRFFDQLFDVAMSPDGRYLLVMTWSQLHIADPVTMNIIQSVNLPSLLSGNSQQLAVMNDGTVVILGVAHTYSLVSGTLAPFPVLYPNTTGISLASLDGSRAVIATQNSLPTAFLYYDASTNSIQYPSMGQNVHLGAGRLNRDATRYLADLRLYEINFGFLGSVYPPGGPYSFTNSISPDGTRAYTYTDLPPRVHMLDTLTTQDPLNEVSTFDLVDDPVAPVSVVGLDGRALFLVGQHRFVVLPVP